MNVISNSIKPFLDLSPVNLHLGMGSQFFSVTQVVDRRFDAENATWRNSSLRNQK